MTVKDMKLRYYILFFVFSLVVYSCQDPAEKIRENMNTGIDELYKGNYTKSSQYFKEVLKIDSTNSEAHHNLGLVYNNQKKYELAMEEYSKAIQYNPKNGEAYKSRAQLWFFLGDRDKSCEDYVKAEDLGVKNLVNYTRHCR